MAYTLDTNVLIHLLRGSETASRLTNELFESENPTLLISIVTQGEIESIAMQRGFGDKKMTKLKKLISEFLIIPVNDKELVDRYAEIDAYSQGKLVKNPLQAGISARNMGKNDLWIAATASITNTTLLTTDSDFDHLIDSVFLNIIKARQS